jgi:DNA-binding GntR family transcriptional regulator
MPDAATPPALNPRRNLAREVLLSLRAEIISGQLQPGDALAEPVLAKQFGSSRAPVREALIELEREGLVQFELTGRTKVRTLTEQDFDEIRDARVALESLAARRASAKWAPKDSAYLEQNITRQALASTLTELSRLDVEFHEYILRLAANKRLLTLWHSIRWQFEMCLASTHRLQETLACKPHQITVSSHRHLLAALASGKPELAAEKMALHIESSMEWTPSESSTAEDPPKPATAISRR